MKTINNTTLNFNGFLKNIATLDNQQLHRLMADTIKCEKFSECRRTLEQVKECCNMPSLVEISNQIMEYRLEIKKLDEKISNHRTAISCLAEDIEVLENHLLGEDEDDTVYCLSKIEEKQKKVIENKDIILNGFKKEKKIYDARLKDIYFRLV